MIKQYIKEITKIYENIYQSDLKNLTLEQLKENESEIEKFYKNPIVWNHANSKEQFKSYLSYYILKFYPDFMQKNKLMSKKRLDFLHELIQLYENNESEEKIKSFVLKRVLDYTIPIDKRINDLITIDNSYRKIIMESNLDQYNYLYYYGIKVTNNHMKIVDYFNSLDEEIQDNMAKCIVDAFERGMKKLARSNNNILDKNYLILYIPLGFEKIAKKVCKLFNGKYEVIFGIIDSSNFSKQLEYNHRYDYNFYLNEKYYQSYLKYFEEKCIKHKDILSKYAGPILVESFGENRFIPKNGDEIFAKDQELSELNNKFQVEFSNLYMKHIRKNTNFEIISYPCPEIGENFVNIFNDTIKINTLDNDKYEKIHQKFIDVLDKSDYVHIKGKGDNKTDLIVNLIKLENPEKQTKFENCLADVNVPVGEVFTSPKLTGTNGILHVSEIYLNGWKFENLILNIENGMIKNYSISNFETDKENIEYVNEHLLYDNKTLPMGEFAIGTNTHAYVMGNKYKINDKLDILIAEKTRPHFAFGDTCYSMEENMKTYNPDGKEIVAKDNEISIKRDENSYFGCHTDITIPYYELGSIVAIGDKNIPIFENGKFVLQGTEELNIEGI